MPGSQCLLMLLIPNIIYMYNLALFQDSPSNLPLMYDYRDVFVDDK